MAFELGSRAAESGYRLAAYETIGSTSSEAFARARAGEDGRLWVVSAHQSAGHGRRGRPWQTPPGNLAASLLLVDRHAAPFPATLGFVAGLALVRAIDVVADAPASSGERPPLPLRERVPLALAQAAGEGEGISAAGEPNPPPPCGEGLGEGSLMPRSTVKDPSPSPLRGLPSPHKGERGRQSPRPAPRLRLKWPNDVLLDGAKVAGILLEATTLSGGGSALVVGIGVNVANAPAGLPYPTTSLAAAGFMTNAEKLFQALSDCWLDEIAAWDGGRGFADVRRQWVERAAGIGEAIAVAAPGGTIRGIFETIDGDGRLLIRTPEGAKRAVAAGDVHFGAAATAEA